MNLRWLLFDYVDPAVPLDRAMRRKVRSRAFELSWSRQIAKRYQSKHRRTRARKNLLNLIYALIPATFQAAIMIVFFAWDFGVGRTWAVLPLLIVAQVLLTWFTMALIGRLVWRPYVLIALRDMGYEFCLNCDYWLRDLPAGIPHCPECGAERVLIEDINIKPGKSS